MDGRRGPKSSSTVTMTACATSKTGGSELVLPSAPARETAASAKKKNAPVTDCHQRTARGLLHFRSGFTRGVALLFPVLLLLFLLGGLGSFQRRAGVELIEDDLGEIVFA